MSQGFSKWSNNDNSDPNIRAVRFGYSKPILEAELNELQDLNFSSTLHLNRAMFKPNTYFSPSGSTLRWEYTKSEDTVIANLVLTATSVDDVLALNFSGGVVYYYTPKQVGRQILTSVEIPLNADVGYTVTLVCKAKIKTLSPDSSDDDYDSRVAFAVDSRYPSLVSTKRVVLESGFDGQYTEVFLDTFDSVYQQLTEQRIKSLVSDKEACLILGSWTKTSDSPELTSFSDIGSIQKVVSTIEESKYNLLSDVAHTFGTYSITTITQGNDVVYGFNRLVSLDLPLKSTKYAFWTVEAFGNHNLMEVVPFTQPLLVHDDLLSDSYFRVVLFDLFDLVDESIWGDIHGQSWEDLLNQKWFSTRAGLKTPTLTLSLHKVGQSRDGEVEYGTLMVEGGF